MDAGPWLAAATAIAGTIATVIVAIVSNRSQVRVAEAQRTAAREERTEERKLDRELREEERALERQANEEAAAAARTKASQVTYAENRNQRREMFRTLVALERQKAAQQQFWASQSDLERAAADFMLMTRPHEGFLRQKIHDRVGMSAPPVDWWFPWIREWIVADEEAQIVPFSDAGGVAW